MKLNWGHKIAIVYTLFAGFMIFMLILSMQEDHELVTENYYENELQVQTKINASQNLSAADFNVSISSNDQEVLIQFEGIDSGVSPKGKINLYKPDDSSLDQEIDLILDHNDQMSISPKSSIGRYKVSLAFTVNDESYYTEKEILF